MALTYFLLPPLLSQSSLKGLSTPALPPMSPYSSHTAPPVLAAVCALSPLRLHPSSPGAVQRGLLQLSELRSHQQSAEGAQGRKARWGHRKGIPQTPLPTAPSYSPPSSLMLEEGLPTQLSQGPGTLKSSSLHNHVGSIGCLRRQSCLWF